MLLAAYNITDFDIFNIIYKYEKFLVVAVLYKKKYFVTL